MKIQAFSHPCISRFIEVLPRHKFAALKQNKFILNLSARYSWRSWNYHPRTKEYFWPISESCLTDVFKYILANLWINTYQNWNAYQIPYISHNLGIQTISCCVWCVTRSKLVNFWKFRCRKRYKKGLLQLWLLKALKKNFKRIFRNQCGFIYLLPITV